MERRKYQRFDMHCGGLIISNGHMKTVDMVDISQNGALMKYTGVLPAYATPGSNIEVDFFDRDAGTRCCVKATIVRTFYKKDHYYMAVSYKNTNSDIISIVKSKEEPEKQMGFRFLG